MHLGACALTSGGRLSATGLRLCRADNGPVTGGPHQWHLAGWKVWRSRLIWAAPSWHSCPTAHALSHFWPPIACSQKQHRPTRARGYFRQLCPNVPMSVNTFFQLMSSCFTAGPSPVEGMPRTLSSVTAAQREGSVDGRGGFVLVLRLCPPLQFPVTAPS